MDKKGRRRTTLSDIDEQIEQKAKRRHMVQQRAERFAKIAAQVGLADVDINDEALAFKSHTLRNRSRAGPGRADDPPARLTPSMRDPVHGATLEWSPCLALPMS